MARIWNKMDRTTIGKGGWQRPSMLISGKRYRDRRDGLVAPLEYGSLEDAVRCLE